MTASGRSLLLAHGLITDDEAAKRSRERELKPNTLDHEVLIADVHVALELVARHGPIRLRTWKEGDEIADAFQAPNGSKVTIWPDAFFQLTDTRLPEGKNTRSIFLEADRSTMLIKPREGSRRFHDKFHKYIRYFEARGHREKYGKQTIRVVTITEKTRRPGFILISKIRLLDRPVRLNRISKLCGCSRRKDGAVPISDPR